MIATLWAAIDVLTSRMIDDAVEGSGRNRREVVEERGGIAAMRCDALTQLCEQSLAADPAAAERGDVGRLTLVIDTDTLEAIAISESDSDSDGECTLGGVRVAPVVAGRWACDIRASVMVENHGHAHDEGHTQRLPNRRLRRALQRRDRGMCRFPGCATAEWLHAHHIVHWSKGGATDLTNLVSLCGFHHHLVHEGAWTLAVVEPLTGDVAMVAAQNVPAGTLEPRSTHDRLDFAYVVSVITDSCRQSRAGFQ